MAVYSLTVESTSNNNVGTATQYLMPASRGSRLLAVLIKQQATAAGENSGRWVVDRISAVTAGSSLTPLKTDDASRASEISDATKTISTTLAATNTVQDTAVVELNDGWNVFGQLGLLPELQSGVAKGFSVRRGTAPTGARVVGITMIWEEL